MATEILRPNAAGDYANLEAQYPSSGAHWDKVDEVVADDEATYVGTNSYTAWVKDAYNLQDTAIPDVFTINSVTVYFRFGDYPHAVRAYAQPFLRLAGVETAGAEYDCQGFNWKTYSQVLARPGGGSWSVSDLNSLQVGIGLLSVELEEWGYPSLLTQIYVEVDYSPRQFSVSSSVSIGVAPSASRSTTSTRASSVLVGVAPSATRAITFTRASAVKSGIVPVGTAEFNIHTYLCVASRASGSVQTTGSTGVSWTTCAHDAAGALQGAYFALYDNRLCVIRYQNAGFAYSPVNDTVANWTDKPKFPNLPTQFTGMFTSKDASDASILYFLTQKGMYYLDVFSNFIFNPTEITWEEDSTSGKKGLYWKGDTYVAVGKGIYKVSGSEVTLVGPDHDDGLPEEMQGTVTDMIGVGFWLVIAVDGGNNNKSSILKRYITGNHWHPVYVTSAINSPIKTLFWDNGTLYFGEGTNVKSLSFPTVTDNVNKLSTQTRAASGTLVYPYFHSVFETMPKVAHKVWATTRDCNANETIAISYRKDEETDWTSLGSFTTSPRPTALSFGATGVQFERIQLRATYARGSTTTNSPKIETLTLEYRVIPPTLWGWDVRIAANTAGDRKGQDIIDALKTALESKTLLAFYPSGDKSKQVYYVQIKSMPGNEKGTEFGTEGVYLLGLSEVVE